MMRKNLTAQFTIFLTFLFKIRAFTISQIYGEELIESWNVYVSGPFGTTSQKDGVYFNDFVQSLNGQSVQPSHWPSGINIRSGDSIDAIQVFYGNYKGRLHGWSDGGRLHKIRLYDGDKIIKVKGTRGIGPGATVDSLTFFTSNKHVFGPYGSTDHGHGFTARPPRSDCYLAWISGQADIRIGKVHLRYQIIGKIKICPSTHHYEPGHDQVRDMLLDDDTRLGSAASKKSHFILSGYIMLIITTLFII